MAMNAPHNKPVEDHVPFYSLFSEWLISGEVFQEQEYTPLDLVQVVSVLRACGFVLQNVTEEQTSSAASGNNYLGRPVGPGCLVDVRCPESKLRATLFSNYANCLCPKKAPNWSVTWAGAVAGEAQLEVGGNNTSEASPIPDLEPCKIELVKDVMRLLLKYVWPREDDIGKVAELKNRRSYRSLESLTAEPPLNFHQSSSVPNICIQSIQMNHVQTTVSTIYNNFNLIKMQDQENLPNYALPAALPAPADPHPAGPPPAVPVPAGPPPAVLAPAVRKATDSKNLNGRKTNPQRLSLPNMKLRTKSPTEIQEKLDKEMLMQSAMMRGKRYAETLKQRNLVKH